MDYEKLFDKLTEKIGKEKMGWLTVGLRCPHAFGLPDTKDCGKGCRRCWAKALGLEEE